MGKTLWKLSTPCRHFLSPHLIDSVGKALGSPGKTQHWPALSNLWSLQCGCTYLKACFPSLVHCWATHWSHAVTFSLVHSLANKSVSNAKSDKEQPIDNHGKISTKKIRSTQKQYMPQLQSKTSFLYIYAMVWQKCQVLMMHCYKWQLHQSRPSLFIKWKNSNVNLSLDACRIYNSTLGPDSLSKSSDLKRFFFTHCRCSISSSVVKL